MTNDQFLIVSYFAVAALAIAFAGGAWLYLRRSFDGLTQAVSRKEFSLILRRLFPAGLILPAFLGFISVSYRGCGMSYEEIVRERLYLIQINREQIFASLVWLLTGLLFWDFIILLVLRFARAKSPDSGDSSSPRTRLR